MAGKFLVVGPGGGHVDAHLVVSAYRRAVLNGEVPVDGLETAAVTAGDLGTDEIHLRGGREHVFRAGFRGRRSGFFNDCGNLGVGGFVGRVFAGGEQKRRGEQEGGVFVFHVGMLILINFSARHRI